MTAAAAGDWDFSPGEENGTDDVNDAEIFYTSTSLSKLQFRSGVSKAKWKSEIGMAEVIEKESKLWIIRGMIHPGALVVMDDNGASLSLKDIYAKIAEGKIGCCWELFEAYKRLKSLGYIVGRHGVPWSMKGVDSSCNSSSFQGMIESYGTVETEHNDTTSIAQVLSNFAGGSVEAEL